MYSKNFALVLVAISICIGALFYFFKEKQVNTDAIYIDAYQKHTKIFSPQIPVKLDLAGEDVPLDIFYVRESLDRELVINAYLQASTQLCIKRAYRYFPVVEPILKEYSIPDDFKYLMVIESGIENRVSPANAAGYWQFLKDTGIGYGLEITDEVDERYSIEKSTQAACKYLRDAYKKFGNWTLAAASYNVGMGGVDTRLTKQSVRSYYDMSLPLETARYVFRILALKLIMANPTQYGYYLREKDLYPPLKLRIIDVTTSVPDLIQFANDNKVNLRIIRELNPWLRGNSLTVTNGKTYQIQIPADGALFYKVLQEGISDQLIYMDTMQVKDIF